MEPARDETGVGEDAPVLGLAPVMPALEVAFHVVPGRVRFQKGHAAQESGNVTDAPLQGCVADVLQHVRADDEIEPTAERHRGELLEGAQLDVAPLAVPPDDILARVDTDVPDVGTDPTKLGAPGALAGADVEHGPDRAAQEVLGYAGDEPDLAANGLRRVDPGTRIAVPFGVVGFVIRLAAGGIRRSGRSHA